MQGYRIDGRSYKKLFNGESVTVTGKLHSPKHNQYFDTQDAKLQILKESKDSDRLTLSINGQNILDWFRQKYQEVKQAVRPRIRPAQKPKSIAVKELKVNMRGCFTNISYLWQQIKGIKYLQHEKTCIYPYCIAFGVMQQSTV